MRLNSLLFIFRRKKFVMVAVLLSRRQLMILRLRDCQNQIRNGWIYNARVIIQIIPSRVIAKSLLADQKFVV